MFGGNHTRTTTRRALRMGMATLGAGVILAGYSGIAVAAPAGNTSSGPSNAVTGTPVPHSVGAIPDGDDNGNLIAVSRFKLTLTTDPNNPVITYCIDLHHDLANGKTYVEGDWSKANPQSDMPHILWVLDHSGPLLDGTDVLAAAGAPTGIDRADDIVYMATQAAVWHFSDTFHMGGQELKFGGNGHRTDGTAKQNAALQKVYAYLTGPDNTGESEPAPALSITPDSLSGQVDKAIGPFTVKTTAKTIALTASDGAKLVDGNGKPVTSVANGDAFSVVLDKAGTATVDAKGSATVPVGRIFVFQDKPDQAQKLVVATPSTLPVSAKVTVTASTVAATPSPSPSPQARAPLANTGATPWPKVAIGVLLLALGTGLTLLARRRRTT